MRSPDRVGLHQLWQASFEELATSGDIAADDERLGEYRVGENLERATNLPRQLCACSAVRYAKRPSPTK